MKRVFFPFTFASSSLVFAACGGTGGESGELVAETGLVMAISHEKGQEPRGDLSIEAEGNWMYGSTDLCLHTQGSAHLVRKFVAFSERAGTAGALGRELLEYTSLVLSIGTATRRNTSPKRARVLVASGSTWA